MRYTRSLKIFSLNQIEEKLCLHNLILKGRLSGFGKENLRERVSYKFGKKKKKGMRPQIYKCFQKSLTLLLVHLFFPSLIYFCLSFKTVIERVIDEMSGVKKLGLERRSLNNHNNKQYHHETPSTKSEILTQNFFIIIKESRLQFHFRKYRKTKEKTQRKQ